MADDSKILEHIRKRWDYVFDEWRETRTEGRLNMRYVSGDPWDPEEKRARQAAKRPCLSLDEIGQYVNKAINSLRANPRAIKVEPRGGGANDKTAEFRQGLIRQIEYQSNAQQAYTCMFENQVQRNIGAFRIVAEYIDPKRSSLQKLCIDRIANPETVFPDPDAKKANFADMKDCFVIEEMSHDDFKRRWPKAKTVDFSMEMQQQHPMWIKTDRVQVAEYWQIEQDRETVYDLEDGRTLCESELEELGAVVEKDLMTFPDGTFARIKRERVAEEPRVVQYITNGVEILETNPWGGEVVHADGKKRHHGKRIPIIVATGKEIFVDEGAGSKRLILSAVSLARDPVMLYCYYRTNQAEFAGMMPKVPAIGYEGQFENHESEWENANRQPIAYLQAKPTVDGASGILLPLPQARQYDASPIAVMDQAAESARRAIQSAFGMYEAAVGKSDSKAKSGIAIQRLQEQSEVGTYHFRDNHDMALCQAGEILDDLIPLYYDTEREQAIRRPDDTQEIVKMNQPIEMQQDGEDSYSTNVGEHDITISTAPSFDSQRQEASAFADSVVSNPAVLQSALQGSKQAQELLSLSIRMRQLGPIGDEMADVFAPPDEEGQKIPPEIQQGIQKLQQQLQAMNAYAQQKDEEVKQLQAKLDAQVVQNQAKAQMTAQQDATKKETEAMKAANDRWLLEREQEFEAMMKRIDVQLKREEMAHADQQVQRSLQHDHEMAEHSAALQPQETSGEGV